jgi:hypothetical protein
MWYFVVGFRRNPPESMGNFLRRILMNFKFIVFIY